MKWSRLILLAVVAALGVWAWTALHPSAERLIRKQLDGVARAASFGSGEGSLATLAAADNLGDFFSTNADVQVELPDRQEHRLAGREEIRQAAMAARAAVQALSVTFPGVAVTVNADQESAVADVLVLARVPGERDTIERQMKFTLRKIDGQWLIVKVETVRA